MKKYTLYELLEEIKKQTPKFKKGQFFETLKPIYPNEKVKDKDKNIYFGNKKVTKPLACSSKSKKEFKKDNSPFYEFFKDNTRGDFLEIIETDGITAKCLNRSIKEDILEKYYNNNSVKYITITFDDVINGNVKRVYRGIKKYIYGGKKYEFANDN